MSSLFVATDRKLPRGVVPHRTARWAVWVSFLLLAGSGVLFALYFLHLSADFPHHSPWMDWAKYTDEGWYGDAAIRHFELGHWYVPGDFNPAVALPVWPFLEALVFRFSGVSLVAARALTVAVFGLILVLSYVLLRTTALRASAAGEGRLSSVAPAATVFLLVANPFCFAFMRMAILEPLLVLLMLVTVLVANALEPSSPRVSRRVLPALGVGVLLPLLILTKTTGLFLIPAVVYLLAARAGFRLRLMRTPLLLAGGLAVTLWLLYFGLVVRPHLLADYRYLFSANGYTGITLGTAAAVVGSVIRGGLWTGRVVYSLALVAVVGSFAVRALRREPIAVTLALWAMGYGSFLAYHNNIQPRYYIVIVVPLTLLLPLSLDLLWRGRGRVVVRPLVVVASGVIAVAAVGGARQTIRYARAPQYTFLNAARTIRSIIDSDPSQSHLLLSISGSDITLMTGVPSICDDFGTLDLEERVNRYHPGWYASWNQVDDDKMDALTPQFHLERVAAIPAYDDPDRNLLILYRLDPAKERRPRHRRPRKPLPARLVTASGQQPSAAQLEH